MTQTIDVSFLNPQICLTEREFHTKITENFSIFDLGKIIKIDFNNFPDIISDKDGKQLRIEVERKTSDFINHKHPLTEVDYIICSKRDVALSKPTFIVKNVSFQAASQKINCIPRWSPDAVHILNYFKENLNKKTTFKRAEIVAGVEAALFNDGWDVRKVADYCMRLQSRFFNVAIHLLCDEGFIEKTGCTKIETAYRVINPDYLKFWVKVITARNELLSKKLNKAEKL